MNEDLLHQIALKYRALLLPLWLETHQSWDDPIPHPLSKNMCRYTCLFMKQELAHHHEIQATIIIGRPEKEGSVDGQYGFKDKNGLFWDHAWLTVEDKIIDITADQFGDDPIIISDVNDTRYIPTPHQEILLRDLSSLEKRISSWKIYPLYSKGNNRE